jgi:hypothetical protein
MRASLLLLILILSGCTGSVLRWTPTPPKGPSDGRVYLTAVRDLRGRPPHVIGHLRGQFGIPTEIWVSGALSGHMARYVRDTIWSAGLGVTDRPDQATAHVAVDIHDFFCDGTGEYRAAMVMALSLLDPRTRGLRQVSLFRGEAHSREPLADCALVLSRMVQEQYGRLTAFWQQPEQYVSALGPPR